MRPKTTEANQRWDEVYGEKFMTMWYPHEDIIRFTARLIKKRLTYDDYQIHRNVKTILDLGCGNGRHAIYFAREGFAASGIDVSPRAIKWATDWAKRENLEVDFRVADITELPYTDKTFDVVVSHGVLDHIRPETAKLAVAEVKRVLNPNGLFYCDLRSTDDFEYGVGEEAAPNTFVVDHGFEAGLVQHFFNKPEIDALFDGLFRIIYSEISESRLGPDFQRKFSRWILALEAN